MLPALAAAAGACSIAETTTVPGEERVVVEGVLRTDAPVQYILLHRSVQGREVRGVPGAAVTVLGDSGRVERFTPVDTEACVHPVAELLPPELIRATCYASAPGDHWVNAGQRYRLEIALPGGGDIRGQLQVPGAFVLRMPVWADGRRSTPSECWLPPHTRLTVRWTPAPGAWSYVAPARVHGLAEWMEAEGIPSDLPEPFDMTGLAVSGADTVIVFPTEFGVFERFQYDPRALAAIQDGLPAGVDVELAVAATERNYVNGVRGGRFNPSGQVRISSVSGAGVGVFGALVPLHLRILVRDTAPAEAMPRCDA